MSLTFTQISHWARRYGTPLYIYNLDDLQARVAALQAALPEGARIYHSLKSNPLPALLQASVAAGCLPEICSSGELAVALQSGCPAEQFLYSGPGKSSREMDEALHAGVRRFSVESWGDLARLNQLAVQHAQAQLEVLLRVNPAEGIQAGLAMSGSATQFGFEEQALIDGAARLRELAPNVSLLGLHVYYGTQIPNEDSLLASFTAAIACGERISAALAWQPRVLDLGGGFPWPYATEGQGPDFSQLRERLAPVLAARQHTRAAALWFESGRYITAACGTWVSEVLDVKTAKDGQTFVVMDSGINHLGGMAGLGRVVRPYSGVQAAQPAQPDSPKCALVGPLCSPLDRLASQVPLAQVQAGDFLAIPNTGAYGLSASLIGFLSHPAPKELVLQNGQPRALFQLNTGHRELPLGTANNPLL
jgi:diaminopimelate decarboxylase